jgi:hypothetical protein
MRIPVLAVLGFLAGAAAISAQTPTPEPTPQPTPGSTLAGSGESVGERSLVKIVPPAAVGDMIPSFDSLTDPSIAPSDPFMAGVRRDSETCRLIKALHACRLQSLNSKKRKWEEISGRLSSLETLYKSVRDEEFVSPELLKAIEVELAEAMQTTQTPALRFTPDEARELAVLRRNQTYIAALCDRNATPSPYYGLRVGAEGFWRNGSPTDGFATVDFAFLNPAWFRAKLKFAVIDLPKGDKCCTKADFSCLAPEQASVVKTGDRLAQAVEDDFCPPGKNCAPNEEMCRISLRDVFLREADESITEAATERTAIETQKQGLKQESKSAKSDIESNAEKIEAAEASLREDLKRLTDDPKRGNLDGLHRQLVELDKLRAKRKSLIEKETQRGTTLADLEKRRTENSGAAPLCRALDEFEKVTNRQLTRLEEPSSSALRFGRPRVGPFVLPDPVEVAIAPIWFNARLGTEPVPDPTKGHAAGDPLFDNEARPIVSFGLQKLFNIPGSTVILGPYAGAGTVLGSLPGEHEKETASRRTFFDLGFYSQTQYRVSASDTAAKIRDVVGSLYLGYRRANYLQRGDPKAKRSDLPINAPDRAIAELRLRYEMGSEQTVKPFIYVIIDRSASGSKKLARDRMGIAFEVDLKKAFTPFGKALGFEDMAPPNPTP